MDKSKKIQKKGNQTAFFIGMVLILILIAVMMYL
jgi:predicted nucleic acid-binding Zn ribbon protein